MDYQFVEEEKRIVIQDQNNNEIGEITFIRSGRDKIIISHTGVEESHRGQGLAEQLVAKLVEKAKDENIKIIPLCPFAKIEFERKPEYWEVLFE
jgi:predicted GNAT family acetyltransferase